MSEPASARYLCRCKLPRSRIDSAMLTVDFSRQVGERPARTRAARVAAAVAGGGGERSQGERTRGRAGDSDYWTKGRGREEEEEEEEETRRSRGYRSGRAEPTPPPPGAKANWGAATREREREKGPATRRALSLAPRLFTFVLLLCVCVCDCWIVAAAGRHFCALCVRRAIVASSCFGTNEMYSREPKMRATKMLSRSARAASQVSDRNLQANAAAGGSKQ